MTKPTKWHVRPAKTQISLGIQADQSRHWAHMSVCWFCHEAAEIFFRSQIHQNEQKCATFAISDDFQHSASIQHS